MCILFQSMKQKDYAPAIKARIDKAKCGKLFVMTDFADLAPNNAANRVITRLVDESKLRMIIRGVYQKPVFNDFLKDWVEPTVGELAYAIARRNGWQINPDGDTALNLMGLTTQVPSTWCFVSDGPYKSYSYGNGRIMFKHSSNRLMGKLSNDAAMFVQAMRALGQDHVDSDVIERLLKRFSKVQADEIEVETRIAPDWIHANAITLKELHNA